MKPFKVSFESVLPDRMYYFADMFSRFSGRQTAGASRSKTVDEFLALFQQATGGICSLPHRFRE